MNLKWRVWKPCSSHTTCWRVRVGGYKQHFYHRFYEIMFPFSNTTSLLLFCLLTLAKKQMVAIQCTNYATRPFHRSPVSIRHRAPMYNSAAMAGQMGSVGESGSGRHEASVLHIQDTAVTCLCQRQKAYIVQFPPNNKLRKREVQTNNSGPI